MFMTCRSVPHAMIFPSVPVLPPAASHSEPRKETPRATKNAYCRMRGLEGRGGNDGIQQYGHPHKVGIPSLKAHKLHQENWNCTPVPPSMPTSVSPDKPQTPVPCKPAPGRAEALSLPRRCS